MIGSVYLSTGLLCVRVFSTGLSVKVLFCKQVFISSQNVHGISEYQRILRKGIRIDHASDVLRTPLVVYSRKPDQVVDLRRLFGDLV